MNCKNCKIELIGKQRAYCSEKCKWEWNKYHKPFEPKPYQRNESYYHEHTTNYGRNRSAGRGSGGWGIGPNVIWFWAELTEEKLKNKSPNEKIKLGTLRIVTVRQARNILKRLVKMPTK